MADAAMSQQSALLLKAVESGASYCIEGSSDWTTKPGRLTVWIDLSEDEWDVVYDTLDYLDDGTSNLTLTEEAS